MQDLEHRPKIYMFSVLLSSASIVDCCLTVEADFDDVGGDDLMIVIIDCGFVIVFADYLWEGGGYITKNDEERKQDLILVVRVPHAY